MVKGTPLCKKASCEVSMYHYKLDCLAKETLYVMWLIGVKAGRLLGGLATL